MQLLVQCPDRLGRLGPPDLHHEPVIQRVVDAARVPAVQCGQQAQEERLRRTRPERFLGRPVVLDAPGLQLFLDRIEQATVARKHGPGTRRDGESEDTDCCSSEAARRPGSLRRPSVLHRRAPRHEPPSPNRQGHARPRAPCRCGLCCAGSACPRRTAPPHSTGNSPQG